MHDTPDQPQLSAQSYVSPQTRLMSAALAILDTADPRVAASIEGSIEQAGSPEIRIDWPQLEQTLRSSSEQFRLDVALSLANGTPVNLQALEHCDSATSMRIALALVRVSDLP